MKKILKLLSFIAVVALLVIVVLNIFKKEDGKIGAYNNQYDGVIATKVLTSSSLTTSTATYVTQPATGDFYIDNVVVSTDSTGLAAGTNFQLLIDSPAYGLKTAFFATAVSGLGANKTLDINTASVTKQRVILQDGDRVVAYCTTANCTGAGKIRVDLILKKVTQGAAIIE